MSKFVDILKQDIIKTLSMIMIVFIFGSQAFQVTLPSIMKTMNEKMNVVYGYSIDEMVRQVEKQYTKIKEKPDDFYQSDLSYVINNTWPRIPDERKTETLTMQYDFLLSYYKQHVLSEISFAEKMQKTYEYAHFVFLE